MSVYEASAGLADLERGARANALPSYASYRATQYFGTLDVLRALAILAVIWHHTGGHIGDGTVLSRGYHGVTLFFAISGFLIVTLMLREKERTGDISVHAFMIKRALRILPLYYATLLLYVGLVAALEKDPAAKALFFSNLPAFATFTTNWLVSQEAPRVIFYFAWSLAAEEQFYLIWPWVERVKGVKRFGLFAALLLVLVSGHFLGQTLPAGEHPGLLFALSKIPAAIALGALLAHCLHDPLLFKWLSPVLGRRGAPTIFLAGLIAVMAATDQLGAFAPALIDVFSLLLVGSCVIRRDNDLARVLQVPPISHIGVVSYGMYLLHMIAVSLAKILMPAWATVQGVPLFMTTTLAATAIATVSFYTFEKYIKGLRRHWLRPELKVQAQPAGVAA